MPKETQVALKFWMPFMASLIVILTAISFTYGETQSRVSALERTVNNLGVQTEARQTRIEQKIDNLTTDMLNFYRSGGR